MFIADFTMRPLKCDRNIVETDMSCWVKTLSILRQKAPEPPPPPPLGIKITRTCTTCRFFVSEGWNLCTHSSSNSFLIYLSPAVHYMYSKE